MASFIALGVKYLGTRYHGWQKQPLHISVQGCLEHALSTVAAHPVEVTCAGRTDRGVHATNQVVHFETRANRDIRAWIEGVNRYLPNDIIVFWAKEVEPSFHARFSAIFREYRYVICNQSEPILLTELCHREHQPLDVSSMHQAAQLILGEHDFTSFRSSRCQSNHAVRCLLECEVSKQGHFINIDVVANSFLHHMVRYLVGSLLTIGTGQRSYKWLKELLDAKKRTPEIIRAPAKGLYLTFVGYPKTFILPIERIRPQYLVG